MEKIQEILEFWFGNGDEYKEYKEYKEYWFDQSKDDYIISNYSSIEKELSQKGEMYHKWLSYPNDDGKLAMIIVFDQFTRSIYRNDQDVYKKYKNDDIAFELSQYFFQSGKDLLFSFSRRIFLLMPYRHRKDSDYLDFVLEKLEEYEEELGPSSLLNRFRNATYMSYTNLTDRIFRSICDECKECDRYDRYYKYEYIIDKDCLSYQNQCEYPQYPEYIIDHTLYKTLKMFVRERNIKNIGISLSGGVDSMVISYLLKRLEIEKEIDKVYALHLEYSNRQESVDETNFISSYCGKLNIPLYVRIIDYMNRDSVDRNFYEEETKKIRFHSYRYLSEKHSIEGWCLGHHSGDISENVIMNICNGRELLDLKVMEIESKQFGTTLFRPFLEHPKTDIYDFSKRFSIPYLRDTTPDWSCRGVIRRKVLPSMESQWPHIKDTLIGLANQSKEWSSVVENFVLKPIKNTIKIDKENKTVEFEVKEEYLTLPHVVWTNLFLHMFHNIGKKMISKKNIIYFLKTLSRNIEKDNCFMFSNGMKGSFRNSCLNIF